MSSNVRRRAYSTRWVNTDTRFDERPGCMDATWLEKGGLSAGVKNGEPLTSELHPHIPTAGI